jgi:hypothetical protein
MIGTIDRQPRSPLGEGRYFVRAGREVAIEINSDIIGKTHNVSVGGALCTINKMVSEADDLRIVLRVPDGEILVDGTVVRCDKSDLEKDRYLAAVYFDIDRMSELTKKKLSHFLRK